MKEISLRSKSFGSDKILGEIRINFDEMPCVAVLGESGVGKTTLMRVITGLESADDFHVDGIVKRSIIFQEPLLLPWKSVLENITALTAADSAKAIAMLERVGLAEKAKSFPGQLSLGQQRRVAIARALCADCDLILLDEPFVSLDEKTANDMMDLVRDTIIGAGICSMIVTHSIAEAKFLTDKIFILEGRPAKLLRCET